MSSDKPPAPDAGSDDGGDGQPQIVVDDPEDFAQTRQLRSIFDARDAYIEQRQQANMMHEQEGLRWTKMNRHIFRYLQDFAMSVEPLLLSHERGREIWTEKEYSIEKNFVQKGELASLEEAKQQLKQLAANYVQRPVTKSQLRELLDAVGMDVEDGQLKQIADWINRDGETNRSRQTQSVTKAIQQLKDSQTSRDADTAGIQSDRPASRVNLSLLQSSIQQTAVDTQPAQPDLSRVVDAIFRSVERRSRGFHSSNQKEKLNHRARVLATDWGWSVTGVQSLVGEVPQLAYSKKGGTTFKTTAPPQWLSNEVFRDIQQFVDDVGLGVDFDSEQQTKITDEVLQEVDTWRQKNVK